MTLTVKQNNMQVHLVYYIRLRKSKRFYYMTDLNKLKENYLMPNVNEIFSPLEIYANMFYHFGQCVMFFGGWGSEKVHLDK